MIEEREPKIWKHSSKDSSGGKRTWLHWGETVFHFDRYFRKAASHNILQIKIGGEENTFNCAIGIRGLFCFFFGAEDLFPRKIERRISKIGGYSGRYYGISQFEEYISIDFHRSENGWDDSVKKGIHKMINWHRILFGKQTTEKTELGTYLDYVPMPEGRYLSEITVTGYTYKWKRFKKSEYKRIYSIRPDTPIPEPGKGESGWDIEDDALIEGNYAADSMKEALIMCRDSAMKTRERRASRDWIPAGGFKVQEENGE